MKNNTVFERYNTLWTQDSSRIINSASDRAKEIYLYVQECGHFKALPGYYTERANLDSYLILYTISGQGVLRLNESGDSAETDLSEGREYLCRPGTAALIDCRHHHSYTCAGGDPAWEFFWVHFNGKQARGYYNEFRAGGYRLLEINRFDAGGNVILPSFDEKMRSLVSLFEHRDVAAEPQASLILTGLLTDFILDHYLDERHEIALPDYIDHAKSRIETDYSSPLTLESLSKGSNVSKYYLAHEFKKYTGMAINEYIILTRINHAKDLLQSTDRPVEQIADEVGMGNTSYFIRAFKAREGITPAVYRRQWKIK